MKPQFCVEVNGAMTEFPQYRKYAHGRSYFKVLSTDDFEQLEIIGNRFHLETIRATVYPDKVLILDMLENTKGHWEVSSAEEYEAKLAWCKANLKAM
jgi:hypothetical protein